MGGLNSLTGCIWLRGHRILPMLDLQGPMQSVLDILDRFCPTAEDLPFVWPLQTKLKLVSTQGWGGGGTGVSVRRACCMTRLVAQIQLSSVMYRRRQSIAVAC